MTSAPRDDSFQFRMVQAARESRKTPTLAEKALWAMVRGRRCSGLYFRRQAVFGPFRVDFLCDKIKLVIELDGSIHSEPDIKARDILRQTILENEYGLRFLRFTNDEILVNPQTVRARILEFAEFCDIVNFEQRCDDVTD